MKLRPLGNSILFEFTDDNAQGKFIPKSSSGIILTNQDQSAQGGPKWGKVLAVGDKVDSDITVGIYILIDALQWTIGHEWQGSKIWKTDDTKIVGVSDEKVTYY